MWLCREAGYALKHTEKTQIQTHCTLDFTTYLPLAMGHLFFSKDTLHVMLPYSSRRHSQRKSTAST